MRKIIIVFFVLFAAGLACSGANSGNFDYIIKNGKVVDGTGNPWFSADIGIIDNKIIKVGAISEEKGKIIIDASGKIVSPGFIDMHSHADARILEDRTAHNLITQGATTVVCGNCGGSKLNLKTFFEKLNSGGIALNFATLVGHNTVRRKVMGNAGREPALKELEEIGFF